MTRAVKKPACRHGPAREGKPMVRPHYRMSRAMVDAIDAAAAHEDLTAPAWLRSVVADRLGINNAADRQPVRAYSGGKQPEVSALTALRLQFRQTGGLITQGAKAARLAGIPTHPDLEIALADIKHAITVITEWQHALRPGVTGGTQETHAE